MESINIKPPIKIEPTTNYMLVLKDADNIFHYFNKDGSYDGHSSDPKENCSQYVDFENLKVGDKINFFYESYDSEGKNANFEFDDEIILSEFGELELKIYSGVPLEKLMDTDQIFYVTYL